MTAPSRYRGQPVSEGIGLGQIYHGDSRDQTNGHRQPATEEQVRAAFAAVARDRAALAADLRRRGQEPQAAIVDIAALIAADSALITPVVEAVGPAPTARTRSTRSARPRPRCWPRCPTPTWPSARATSVRWPAPWLTTWVTREPPRPRPRRSS